MALGNNFSIIDRIKAQSTMAHRPLQASLELTNRCNERCSHCYLISYEDDAKRLLSLDQWKTVLTELKSAGVLYLILMGGEAMLSPHFWGVTEAAVQKGFSVSMITNGLLIKDFATAERLAEIGFSHLTFSLYSLDPQIHDAMTGIKGAHQKTMAAIEFCRQAKIPSGVNCLLTEKNIKGFFELNDWCREQKLEIKADPMVTPKFNGDITPTRLRPRRDQLEWYYRTTAEKWPAGIPRPDTSKPEDYMCNAGKGKCAVTAYGELLPCIEVRESMGQLDQRPFNELWSGLTAQKWRNFRTEQLLANGLGKTTSFCDHCPGMALHELKDPLKISSYSKELAQVKESIFHRFTKSDVPKGEAER